MLRKILLLLALLAAIGVLAVVVAQRRAPSSSPPNLSAEKQLKSIGEVDLIKVDKSERLMWLQKDGATVATYKISLGGDPQGHKSQEGDERTPEGHYIIDWRNPKSGYFLSIHISYPNEQDKAHAQDTGVSPGGNIMIHGQPNGYASVAPVLQGFDWTNGCIAVTNGEMQQIWDAVPNGTPIEISP